MGGHKTREYNGFQTIGRVLSKGNLTQNDSLLSPSYKFQLDLYISKC